MVVESTKHGPLDDIADDDKIFGGWQHLNTILHKDSVGGSSKSAPDDDGNNDDDEDHQSSVSNRSSSVSSLSSSWWGRKDSAGGRWSESREGGNEVQEAIADTLRALKVGNTLALTNDYYNLSTSNSILRSGEFDDFHATSTRGCENWQNTQKGNTPLHVWSCAPESCREYV